MHLILGYTNLPVNLIHLETSPVRELLIYSSVVYISLRFIHTHRKFFIQDCKKKRKDFEMATKTDDAASIDNPNDGTVIIFKILK